MKILLSLALTAVVVAASVAPSLALFRATTTNTQTVQAAADWTPPVATLSAPSGALRGTVRLTASATDADSSVATVAVQLRRVGEQSWVTRCTLTPPATACDVPTTVYIDGTYELRARATDVHGNVGDSPVLTRVFDNTAPTVTLTDPGALIAGTVTLQATVADATSGVASARFQISPAGSGTWTDLCTVTASPYSCVFDTTTVGNGAYDLRVIATDVAGNSATSLVGNRRIDNSPLAVTIADLPAYVRGTTTVTAQVSTSGTSTVTVTIQRRVTGSTGQNSWTTICTTSTAPYTCAWNTVGLTDGDHELRANATNATTSATSTLVDTTIDNTVPTVAVQDPGTPLRGSVDVRATAADVTSGVASVRIQVAPAGTSSWTDLCTDLSSPYSCRFDTTTVTDGGYQFRAIATDQAGNTATSATLGPRQVDNTVSSVSLLSIAELLRGEERLEAAASSSAGVSSVTIQLRAVGTPGWTTLCTLTATPYACTWDSRTVADGLYDLQAVMVDGTGAISTSAIVTARQVDNAPVRGVDVQAFNVAGGTQGRMEAGDRFEVTYSRAIRPQSIIAGWDGSSRAVAVRLRHKNQFGDPGNGSGIDVFTTTAFTQPVHLGLVRTGTDHIGPNQTLTFNATLTHRPIEVDGQPQSTFVVTLGAVAQGGGNATWLRTAAAATMTWTPATQATDIDGVASVGAPVTESGPLDRDF